MRGINEIHDKLFPPDGMNKFERESQEMIAAGTNKCPCGEPTMERIYPVGHHLSAGWVCSKHAQAMWQKGILHGSVVFNMEGKP